MGTTDIIPDIHGQAAKLLAALDALGWVRRAGSWRHSDPGRSLVFLGDFIDRGPDNAGTIKVVRDLIDSGRARAIMGNHELNAILFHTDHPETGQPLRHHGPKNVHQHAAFLHEFPLGTPATREAIAWMRTLPFFLEAPGFRAVHACWRQYRVEEIATLTRDGVLDEESFVHAADEGHVLYGLTEELTKGLEVPLPTGFTLLDKDGIARDRVRVRWWNGAARDWPGFTISVDRPEALPQDPLPQGLRPPGYPAGAKPLFLGHYWLTGRPALLAPNLVCLDHSAGANGPLVSYTLEDGARTLDEGCMVAHTA